MPCLYKYKIYNPANPLILILTAGLGFLKHTNHPSLWHTYGQRTVDKAVFRRFSHSRHAVLQMQIPIFQNPNGFFEGTESKFFDNSHGRIFSPAFPHFPRTLPLVSAAAAYFLFAGHGCVGIHAAPDFGHERAAQAGSDPGHFRVADVAFRHQHHHAQPDRPPRSPRPPRSSTRPQRWMSRRRTSTTSPTLSSPSPSPSPSPLPSAPWVLSPRPRPSRSSWPRPSSRPRSRQQLPTSRP